MGLFDKRQLNDKDRQKTIDKMKTGWTSQIKLPEYESVSQGALTKGVATAAFGLVGLAMTMGSSTQQREITAKIRFADKGIVIEKGTVDGKDLRIRWEDILNSSKGNTNNKIILNLVDGSLIRFYVYISLKIEKTGEFIIAYINSRASGTVDDGWNVPASFTPLDEKHVESKPSEMDPNSCSNCGSPIEAGANFCSECGQKI